ncbi:MAG: CHAD domain-containing protein [Mangrovibacterium sp.]
MEQSVAYIHLLFESVPLYLTAIRQRQAADDVHQLRVTLRRLKAGFSVLSFKEMTDDSGSDFAQLVSGLFTQAGKVRETQVNQALVNRKNVRYLEGYVAWQKSAEQKYLKKLIAEMDQFDLAALERSEKEFYSRLSDLTQQRLVMNALAFLKYRQEKITTLQHTRMSNHALHKIRIQLKAMSDCQLLLKNLSSGAVLPVHYPPIKKLNKLVGAWHDEQVLVHSVKLFLRNKSRNKKQEPSLKKWVQRRDHACRQKRRKIYQTIRSLTGLYGHDRS